MIYTKKCQKWGKKKMGMANQKSGRRENKGDRSEWNMGGIADCAFLGYYYGIRTSFPLLQIFYLFIVIIKCHISF